MANYTAKDASLNTITVKATDNTGVLTPHINVDSAVIGAGTALIGKVGIDQTTPGTTNKVSIGTDGTVVLGAGTAGIGKLTANSGVDIGDVDVTSISAGTNTIGGVMVRPTTSGGLTVYHLVSGASTNATVVKNGGGQLYGWYIYNSNAAARKVAFHDASSTPTAGASVAWSIVLPPGAAANVFTEAGIPFATGISITTVTGLADNDGTGVGASDLIINLFYK
jgi:hypothetical protein